MDVARSNSLLLTARAPSPRTRQRAWHPPNQKKFCPRTAKTDCRTACQRKYLCNSDGHVVSTRQVKLYMLSTPALDLQQVINKIEALASASSRLGAALVALLALLSIAAADVLRPAN